MKPSFSRGLIQNEGQGMATREQVRTMVQTVPFRPFVVHLAGGRSFTITHPELISCSVNGRDMFVNDEDGLHLVEMLLVDVIEHVKAPAGGNGTGA